MRTLDDAGAGGQGRLLRHKGWIIAPTAADFRERVSHVERCEFTEISIIRVERPDAVLEKDRREVSIGDEVSPDRHVAGDPPVGVQETVQLRHDAHVRQLEERCDIADRLVRAERRSEDARVCGDPDLALPRARRRADKLEGGKASAGLRPARLDALVAKSRRDRLFRLSQK